MSEEINGAEQVSVKPCLVFEYDPTTMGFTTNVTGQIPLPLLVNVLEVTKQGYVMEQIRAAMGAALQQSQQAQAKQLILPTGPLPPNPKRFRT